MSSILLNGDTEAVLYWIRQKDHVDMFTEGYIGVSSKVNQRWADHKKKPSNQHLANAIKKYGWDNLVKEVILVANKAYCLMIETKLRPSNKIGWNVTIGGGNPPHINIWNKGKPWSDEIKAKISAKKKGRRHTPEIEAKVTLNLLEGGKATRFKKGSQAHNVNVKCPHCLKTGLRAPMHRWHMDQCKFKEI